MGEAIASETILEALRSVEAPGTPGKSIVELGYVKGLSSEPARVAFRVEVPAPLTPTRIALQDRCRDALAPIVLPLTQKWFYKRPTGIAEDRHEQKHGDRGAGDDDTLLAEVHLHLRARGRLDADRRHVGGTLFPVNKIGLQHVPGLFAKNERVAVFQDSARHGEVATILVGAIVVGSVTLAFDPAMRTNDGPPRGTVRYLAGREPSLDRGQELGAFQLGSTVIVLTTREPGVELVVEPGTVVRMGQALARRTTSGRVLA